jgi:hypothetical protein
MEKYGKVGLGTGDNTTWCVRKTKATNTHLEYVIFFRFPRQNCLRERDSLLRLPEMPVLNSNKNRPHKQILIQPMSNIINS